MDAMVNIDERLVGHDDPHGFLVLDPTLEICELFILSKWLETEGDGMSSKCRSGRRPPASLVTSRQRIC